jgi:hypothetical protein
VIADVFVEHDICREPEIEFEDDGVCVVEPGAGKPKRGTSKSGRGFTEGSEVSEGSRPRSNAER